MAQMSSRARRSSPVLTGQAREEKSSQTRNFHLFSRSYWTRRWEPVVDDIPQRGPVLQEGRCRRLAAFAQTLDQFLLRYPYVLWPGVEELQFANGGCHDGPGVAKCCKAATVLLPAKAIYRRAEQELLAGLPALSQEGCHAPFKEVARIHVDQALVLQNLVQPDADSSTVLGPPGCQLFAQVCQQCVRYLPGMVDGAGGICRVCLAGRRIPRIDMRVGRVSRVRCVFLAV